MIAFPLLVLVLCNFAAIGLLPIVFFRRDGTFNLRWLATAAPFFIVPVTLLAGEFGLLAALPIPQDAVLLTEFVVVILCALSLFLIALTVGGHRVPLALWHQDNDDPVQIVTWGAYARIRHPFYTSFLLAFLAGALTIPHPVTIACLLYGAVLLTLTAKREEERLATSEFGEAYTAYLQQAGRFFPRLRS
jgi:protein-S-isoprenylcysteine O-methyltransferase Ste14